MKAAYRLKMADVPNSVIVVPEADMRKAAVAVRLVGHSMRIQSLETGKGFFVDCKPKK